MKGICHIWSRGRHFSPSLPGDRYLILGSPQKRPPGRNLGEHRLVRRSGATSRGTVLIFCFLCKLCVLGSLFCTGTGFLNRFPSHFPPCCPAMSLRKLPFSKLKKFTKTSRCKSSHFYKKGSFFEPLFAWNNRNVVLELIFLCFWHFEVWPKKRSFLRTFPYHSLCKTTISATFLCHFWNIRCVFEAFIV